MNNVSLWIDDERAKPAPFTHWAKTSQEAIEILSSLRPDDSLIMVSFDHDLGYNWEDGHSSLDGGVRDDNSRAVVEWMHENEVYPELSMIHSQNPIGADWIFKALTKDGPPSMTVVKMPYSSKNYE